ncbi:DNA protecting protein DprA [Slackia heliotrinireducens]|uniref:Predicted Rossmann fold nucleotide-binding protein involved in DNA uptake n=1 Tax=Slackia heliotrinireducens (strain ATCC 29202 / DSM 20476 / NCTC 11029 / RHS 1) TaxID=471855 RepID=C7N822_SLAHD|nr:DNA-processing protein DprA [Slackia heliotrinireducens]ACV23057.1 predicted Rossmann fold nucleotide-binding protein involved in DNA uptake [Slackia heliotrinireducens DSM 20476]VEH02005.1 DNA protecting protein DprA [Slackia heliotrinireducens]
MELTGPRTVIARDDERYPHRLLDLPDPPRELHVMGDPGILEMPSLAVVGARKCSPYGMDVAVHIADVAADEGMATVTGGAVGVPTGAMRGTLAAEAFGIVVLGSGLDNPYPSDNIDLFQAIVGGGGCVVTEYYDQMPPRPYMFRERNRLIAALSSAVVVVECGMPSGSFSLCDTAMSLGRPVFAFPGPITSHASTGCNVLIANGQASCVDDYGRLGFYLRELMEREEDHAQ